MHTIDTVLSYVNYYAEWMERDATSALHALQKDCDDNEEVMQGILFLIATIRPQYANLFTNYKQHLQPLNLVENSNEYEVEFRVRRALTEQRLKAISVMVHHGKLHEAVKETLTVVALLLEFSIVLTDNPGDLQQRFNECENGIWDSIKKVRSSLNNLNISIIMNDQDRIIPGMAEFKKSVEMLEGLVQEILITKF